MSEDNKKKEEPQFDIYKNKLVPKAKILNEKEQQELFEKFNITRIQLPKILASDTVSRNLKAKGGDIIEFERCTKTAGLSKYYRIVAGGVA